MAVSKRLRFEILRRDNHTCRYCGESAPDATLTVDHVVPTALGGTDDPSNLVAACKDCNAGKSSSSPDAPLVTDASEDAVRWSRCMSEAAASRRRQRECEQEHIDEFDKAWRKWGRGKGPERTTIPRDPAWGQSVILFLDNGLEDEDLARAMPIAMGANVSDDNRWRYFCGVIWREIRERQEIAKALFDIGKHARIGPDDNPWDVPWPAGASDGA